MQMLIAAALVSFALAALVAAAGLLARGRGSERAEAALRTALQDTPGAAAAPGAGARGTGLLERLAALGRHLEGSRVQGWLLAPEDRLLLEQINWHHRSGTAIFLSLRVLLALLVPIVLLAALQPAGARAVAALVLGLASGLLLPKLALRSWAQRLRRRAHDELPMLIDLLRLLQSVGFSIDQSLQMLGDKLHAAIPLLGRELQEANIAYIHGRTRAQSLRRIGESFGDEDLRSLVQMIVQVHQHGGAIQEPLRQFSARLRESRRMKLKDKVGKLSVKMTVVMMVTLLPALMVVLSGPAILALAGAMKRMGS
ncbi:type II secretion system F family protein [Stenotrophomonas sp. HITSZ_GD]|uniref:type II secretion system F family protein n=1 Tax=Stenotrophomonas sp. HITSZ_GD TaxID=3037248 RepID=UPI00240D4840|nr:type II secretion system F family protein [Stenotrophomonas sp. HITSZ_GD]MDG2524437.1 type II secretion system F family protein [Stenotrophomonas sp. HITSZ_GD]